MKLVRALSILFWVTAGCSLVVAGDPAIECQSDEGCPPEQRCALDRGACIDQSEACTEGSCPAGERCDPRTLACEPVVPGPNDDDDTGVVPPDGEAPPDATDDRTEPPPPPPVRDFGESCQAQADCARVDAGGPNPVAGVCAISDLTGSDIPAYCSVACCSSADCPDDYYCHHTRHGSRLCIPFGPETRTAPSGSKEPGDLCNDADECRSGRCGQEYGPASGQRVCLDTCCRDATCPGNRVCGMRNGPLEWVCQNQRGPTLPGKMCTSDSNCRHSLCLENEFCTVSCCSNSNCRAIDTMMECASASASSTQNIIQACTFAPGASAAGASCTSDDECRSNLCINAICSSACCQDSDCPGEQRCVSDGAQPRPHCVQ